MMIALKNKTSLSNQQWMMLGIALALVALIPVAAIAGTGTGSGDFDTIWDTLVDWTQGTLGRVIAGSMVIVGLIMGVARQSIMAFAIGIGAAVGLYNAPDILDAIMGATLPVLAVVPALPPVF